ncbi:bifunctional hydroxymethylpyrimidine kinase/phosphomethylpyrimidine kinase [Natronosalvus hydrolyticus]|uniref:bifunctional hydroxymethylpyrimidine kinase/phosphomethylpyrimidine kinase n=1 Tax=Natronosalvus hydrolyticus TaxID=2979988 RepID=UPI00319DCC12
MQQPEPVARPVGLTIAGSDSGGGAGIQADLKTMAAHGVYGTTAITAVTAQHTRGVESSFVLPLEEIDAQIRAVLEDFDVRAVKTGMLATGEIIDLVTEHAADLEIPLVVDPVMVATSGDRLLDLEGVAAYEDLLEHATLVTPNVDEAGVLTGVTVDDVESARNAGEQLLEDGADGALIKGGHVPGAEITDLLVTDEGERAFTHPRIDTEATHGSGCTLAAAITAGLAKDDSPEQAVERGVAHLETAVSAHYDVGQGPGTINHFGMDNDDD